MRLNTLFIVVLSLLNLPTLALAEDSSLHYQVYANFANLTVDDPEGDTDSTFVGNPGFNLIYDLAARGQRVYGGLEFMDFSINGDTDNIGQDVKGYVITGGYQYQWNISRTFELWLGAGLGLNRVEFTDRFTVAEDGFLGQEFEDRDKSYVSALLNVDSYFNFPGTEFWQIGTGLYFGIPFDDGVQSAGVRLSIVRL